MNILHIIPTLRKGGAERLVLNIVQELHSREGIKVKLITFRDENEYTFLSETIDHEVIPSKVIPSISGKSTIDVNKLQHAIDNFAPDLIHTHLFESEMVLSEINHKGAKRIVHVHDNMVQLRKPSILAATKKSSLTNAFERKKMRKYYEKNGAEFICISQDCYTFIAENLPKQLRKHLLHNAIDTSRFNNENKQRSPDRIVMIGSLVEKKGQELAIRTIKVLRDQGTEMYLDLLGDGPLRSELETLCHQLGIDDLVSFHGNVDFPEDFLAKATLYLHTAIYEPFGLVLIEAMAAGTPVICTDGGGNRDLIKDGENGFILATRAPQVLADKIISTLNSPKLIQSLVKNGLEFSTSFDIRAYVDRLMKLYN